MEQTSVLGGALAEKTAAARRAAMPAIDALDFLWVELTPHCNLSCSHCYAESSPQRPLRERMTSEDWVETLRQAAELGCRRVQFIGGEPTLHPDLPALIAYARSIGFASIEVFTNGTVLTSRLKEEFVRHGVDLAFSVYSADEEVHDAVVRQAGSLARTKATILWAVAAGLTVRAAIIVMEANSGHEDSARSWLRELGVSSVRVDHIRGVGRGASEVAAESSLGELCGSCGKDQLCVSSDGLIYPCVFSRAWPMGSVEAGLRAVLESKSLHDFRGALRASRAYAAVATAACGPEQDPGPCGPEQNPGPCGPEKDPGPCGPEKDPGPCPPEQPSDAEPRARVVARRASRYRGSVIVEDPCGPETPAPSCGPEKDPGPCGPETQPPDCGPEKPSQPCGPEKPTGPCGPEQPQCGPDACPPERA